MKFSENFTLEELRVTSMGDKNTPNEEAKTKLLYLANYVLQPIRDRWGVLQITSAFRSQAVNLLAGGSITSQHILGEAADFIPTESNIKEVYRWIVEDSHIAFGQCIFEKGEWIHISLPRLHRPNHEALIFNGTSYLTYKGTL